jgi:hypothetical protein
MSAFEKPSEPATVAPSEADPVEHRQDISENTAVKPAPTVATTRVEEWR